MKQHRIVGTKLGLERASGFAHQLGFWWAVTGLDYFFGYVDTMANQTPQRSAGVREQVHHRQAARHRRACSSLRRRRSLELTPAMLTRLGVRP